MHTGGSGQGAGEISPQIRAVPQGQPKPTENLPGAFHRLLVAWFSSVTADGMRFAALPLLALSTRPSPAAVSAVAAAMALPWLLVALPAGALVDRLNPARVIAGANLVRAAVAALLVLAVTSGTVSIAVLCLAGFAFTSAETFADSASQSLLVQIVPAGTLERANARFISSENIGLDLLGPLASGALFSVAPWLPFLISAVIFAGTAVLMVGMTGRRERVSAIVEDPPSPTSPGRPSGRPSVSRGLRIIAEDSGLRTLVIAVAVMGGAVAAVEGVLVIYSTSSLHLSASLYPTLLACYSIGLLIAAAVVGRLNRRAEPGVLMIIAIVVIGITLILLGLFPHPAVAWSCFALMGGAGGVWNVLSATRRQRRTPHHMVARVSSSFRAIGWGALPIGAALGGLGSGRFGVPVVCVVAGLVVLLLGCAVAPHFLRPDTTTAQRSDAGAEPGGCKSAPVG